MARHIATSEHAEACVRGVVIAENPKVGPEVEALEQKFLADYKDSVFDIKVRGPPPIRGPFGEATIKLRPGAIPRSSDPTKFWGIAKCFSKTRSVVSKRKTSGWRTE